LTLTAGRGSISVSNQTHGALKMDDKTQGLIRHILTIIGGVAISRGWINEENALAVTGAVLSVIGVIWSWRSKA
jgi:hypothetical protein